jgi:hypothetical protein
MGTSFTVLKGTVSPGFPASVAEAEEGVWSWQIPDVQGYRLGGSAATEAEAHDAATWAAVRAVGHLPHLVAADGKREEVRHLTLDGVLRAAAALLARGAEKYKNRYGRETYRFAGTSGEVEAILGTEEVAEIQKAAGPGTGVVLDVGGIELYVRDAWRNPARRMSAPDPIKWEAGPYAGSQMARVTAPDGMDSVIMVVASPICEDTRGRFLWTCSTAGRPAAAGYADTLAMAQIVAVDAAMQGTDYSTNGRPA